MSADEKILIQFSDMRVVEHKPGRLLIEPVMDWAEIDQRQAAQLRDALSKWIDGPKLAPHEHNFSDGMFCSICGDTLF